MPYFSRKIIALAVPSLLLLGAGCAPVTPVATNAPLTEEQQASANELADLHASMLTVAMIVTENAAAPKDAAVINGPIGCDDRVAYVKVHRVSKTDSVVKDALAALFSVKDTNFDGLYDALANSTFSVDKVTTDSDGATTDVWLKGQANSGGICDDPRIKAQIEYTIKRLRPQYKIYLNGSESAYRCIGNESGMCT